MLVPPPVQISQYVFIIYSRARYCYLRRDKRRNRGEGDKRRFGEREKLIQRERNKDKGNRQRERRSEKRQKRRYFEKTPTKSEVKCGKREGGEERIVVTCGPKRQRNKRRVSRKEKEGERERHSIEPRESKKERA